MIIKFNNILVGDIIEFIYDEELICGKILQKNTDGIQIINLDKNLSTSVYYSRNMLKNIVLLSRLEERNSKTSKKQTLKNPKEYKFGTIFFNKDKSFGGDHMLVKIHSIYGIHAALVSLAIGETWTDIVKLQSNKSVSELELLACMANNRNLWELRE